MNISMTLTPGILVVDDEEKLGRFICMLLKRAGYHAHTCQTVADAQRILMTESWNLVLADIVLSGENGFELVQWIAENCMNLSVVVMTAHSTHAIEAQAERLGISAILHKPFTIEGLRQTINGVLQPLAVSHPMGVLAY